MKKEDLNFETIATKRKGIEVSRIISSKVDGGSIVLFKRFKGENQIPIETSPLFIPDNSKEKISIEVKLSPDYLEIARENLNKQQIAIYLLALICFLVASILLLTIY